MSIVKMRRLRLIAMREDRDALLKDIQRLGCLEIDEPLILAGLICGDYTIEEICDTGRSYCSTITGPNVCGNCVRLVPGCPPAVVTIVNRRRICRWGHCSGIGCGCGCGGQSGCCLRDCIQTPPIQPRSAQFA